MAYLILADRQGEFDRRELGGPVVIGRALDCDLCVRDILLSRKHCRIEPFDDRWVISDLGSKNGTRIGAEVITRHILGDGDIIRIGKIQVSFRAGAFVPPPKGQQRHPDTRPADPKEALSGTVLGFQLFDMEEDSRVSGFPIPRPKPPEPASLRQENVSSIVTQMASKSWDATLSKGGGQAAKPKARAAAKQPAKSIPVPPRPVALKNPPKPPEPEPEVRPSTLMASATAAAPMSITISQAPSEPAAGRGPASRSPSPDRPATIPGWLAGFYLLLAALIGLFAIGVVVVRSNPSMDWSWPSINWLLR